MRKHIRQNPKDRITVDVDNKHFRLERWDNECNFEIETIGNERTNHYEIEPNDKLREGGYEFETILDKKPKSNIVRYTIKSKGVEYYYQPPLTEKAIKEGVTRPEHVVGSYAVYASGKKVNYVGGKEYKTGKVGHIYRPKIKDADGKEVWGELDIKGNQLTVTIPQEFLDSAVYPVIADPTIGYDTVGSSTVLLESDAIIFAASNLDPGENATLNKVYVHASGEDSNRVFIAALLESTGSSTWQKVGDESSEESLQQDTLAWYSADIEVAVTSGSDYYPGVHAKAGSSPQRFAFSFDTAATASAGLRWETYTGTWITGSNTYDIFLVNDDYAHISLYATYEEPTNTGQKPPTVSENSYFTNPDNVFTSNNTYAVTPANQTNYQEYSGFGFSIPTNATINGIALSTEAKNTAAGDTQGLRVFISGDQGANWSSVKTTGHFTDSDSTITIGGAFDDWGETLSPSYFNSDNFWIRAQIETNNGNQLDVDYITATVYYTEPEKTGTPIPTPIPLSLAPTTNDERDIELEGQESANAERDIELSGTADTQSERAIETTGQSETQSERNIETTGKQLSTSERSIEVNGESTANSERAIDISGQSETNSERAIELTGQDSATSERDIVVHGQQSTNTERDIDLIGKVDTNTERAIETTGQVQTSSERAIDISGQDTSTSERSVELHGKEASNSERSVELEGQSAETDTSSERNIEIIGQISTQSERDINTAGQLDTNSERTIDIHGKQGIDTERSVEITAQALMSSERTIELETEGGESTQRDIELHGEQSTDTERAIELEGESATTDVNSERDIVVTGQASEQSERNIETTGQSTDTSERNVEMHGVLTDTSERNIELTGDGSITSERDIELIGKDTSNTERSVETTGSIDQQSERSMELSGIDTEQTERSIELVGKLDASSERNIEMQTHDISNTERDVSLHGVDTTHSERSIELTGGVSDERDIEMQATDITASERNIDMFGRDERWYLEGKTEFKTDNDTEWHTSNKTSFKTDNDTGWYTENKTSWHE